MLKEVIKEFAGRANIADIVICMAGLLVLGAWLLKTSFGRKALVNSPIRRNDMLTYLAFIPFFFWFLAVWLLALMKRRIMPETQGWQNAFADNLILCLSAAPSIVIILVIAKRHFARGIIGFGLNPKTIFKDFGVALLNMLAMTPVILGILILTILAGKLIIGPEFVMPRHRELNEIMVYPQWQVRAIVIVTAVCVVPVIEEMLFRGMLQTLLRSYIGRPWRAIIIASLIFAMFHENPQHWPALFAFGLVLGYAYEKSGSLFRSIFLHLIFNAIMVFSTRAVAG
jgi:membrane protease YdiL (CAAX protease family)